MLEREKDEAMRSAISGLLTSERARLIFDWRARLRSELLGSAKKTRRDGRQIWF
jgi:hypothetical protein